jgi:hypothetical protein
MPPAPTELLGDPLFQLNTLLWLTQPLHEDAGITPLFFRRGFTVYAVAPLLAIPPDVRLAAQNAGLDMQPSTRPDVVLTHAATERYAFIECKRSSFGTATTTAAQALTLLALAGPRAAEIMAVLVSSALSAFLVPDAEREQLAQTVDQLLDLLAAAGIAGGPGAVLALRLDGEQLCLAADAISRAFFDLPEENNPFMEVEAETDPRPLYFIPYDPDVTQSRAEREFCKRVLFERIHSGVVAAAGRAHPPTELRFETAGLLNDGTFGMYDLWETRSSQRHMRTILRQLMRALSKAVNTAVSGTIEYQEQVGWKLRLQDPAHQERVLDILTRFSCETLDLRQDPQPSFDDLEVDDEAD